MSQITIKTRDGSCPSYVFRPAAGGPWPAVLVFMDGLGIRPAMLEVGERLATHGYYVLLPDLFYRSGPYEPMDPHTVFSDPEKRKVLMEKFFAPATPAHIMSDMRAFLDHLAEQPDVRPGGIGTTGYCMGGLMSLTAAGTYPDRIVATASYHGGRLATDSPDSPHLLAPRIRSRVYVAGAIEDPSFPDDMKKRLEEALTQAGVDYEIETYPAKHGWVFRDTPVYDAAAAERHWQTMVALFDATLKRDASARPDAGVKPSAGVKSDATVKPGASTKPGAGRERGPKTKQAAARKRRVTKKRGATAKRAAKSKRAAKPNQRAKAKRRTSVKRSAKRKQSATRKRSAQRKGGAKSKRGALGKRSAKRRRPAKRKR